MNGKYIKMKDMIIDKLLNAVAYVIAFFINIPKRSRRFYRNLTRVDLRVLILTCVVYISLFMAGSICIIYIIQMLSCDIQIVAYVNNTELGFIENTFVIEGARRKVEYEINEHVEEKYRFEYEIKYDFVSSDEKTYLTENDCYRFLNNISSMGVINMYSLYIDGVYIGSLPGESELKKIVEDYQNSILYEIKNADSKIVDIKLYSVIDIVAERRIKTDLSEYEKVYATLLDEVKLNYTTIKHEIFTEVIKCSVEYRDSDTLYIGREEQSIEGSDGIYELIYEAEYRDGELYIENLISEKFLIEPEPTIILRGVKNPPPAVSIGEFIWPIDWIQGIKPYITSYFAEQREEFDGDQYHYGIDIGADESVYIYASDGGYVDYSNESPSYGNMVRIIHKNGMSTYYAHMVERLVEVGENVYPGQIIGKVGMTGVATAPHLHFEIREGMIPVDPLKYLP